MNPRSFTTEMAASRIEISTPHADMPFRFTEAECAFEVPRAEHPDARYDLIWEEDIDLPERSGEPLWNSPNWRLYRCVDQRLLLEVCYMYAREQFQPIALLEPDYASGRLFPRRQKPGGKLFNYPFEWPARPQILGNWMARRHGGFLHAAGIQCDDRMLLFPGRSGVGKSTTCKLWQAEGHRLLNDERNLIRLIDGRAMGASTPFHGELPEVHPGCLPLGGVFFLEQSTENRIQRLSPAQATALLIANAIAPHYDATSMELIMDSFARAMEQVPAYRLWFRPEKAAVELCLDTLNKEA